MAWLQLKIPTQPEAAELIEAAMLTCGALSITYTDNADQPILEPALGETPLWRQTGVTALFNADIDTGAIDQQLAPNINNFFSIRHWEIVEDKDWEREWMQHYHPIRCSDKLWICPSWLAPPDPNAVNVLLDPGLAFGTGTHPTTLLCLQWFASDDMVAHIQGKTVIDYGCGSGILGIAALKLGAKSVIAIDIDPQALLATADNAQRNGIAESAIATYLPDRAPKQAADLVFANILAGPLVNLAPRLTELTQAHGYLCLSGLLDSQGETVLAAYQGHYDLRNQQEHEHWLQMALQKTGSV